MQSIEERVAKLEEAVFNQPERRVKNWRKTVGMFDDDPVMKQVIDEALKVRDEDRAKAQLDNGTED